MAKTKSELQQERISYLEDKVKDLYKEIERLSKEIQRINAKPDPFRPIGPRPDDPSRWPDPSLIPLFPHPGDDADPPNRIVIKYHLGNLTKERSE